MALICQKSVCTALANGIVKRKVGYLRDMVNKRFGWFLDPDGEAPMALTYCPFCGTHLTEIHDPPMVQRIQKAAQPPKLALVPVPVAANSVNTPKTTVNTALKSPVHVAADLSWMPPAPKWEK